MGIEDTECHNGLGFGMTVFVSGCTHYCKNCFNKDTWSFHAGKPFTHDTLFDIRQLLNRKFIKRLTFSGGDPLSLGNREWVLEVGKMLKESHPYIKLWVYTGYTLKELEEQDRCFVDDLKRTFDYLVDGRYDKDATHTLPYRGSDNQKVWDLKEMKEVFNG